MKFKRLFMQRFMSIGDEPVEIIFPDHCGITQVTGFNKDIAKLSGRSNSSTISNAAGKSTLIEGILFALTGKVMRGLSLDDCLHDHAAKNGIVELEYDNVKIVRKIKPNSVHLFIDGADVTQKASKTETKKMIDRNLGVNFETMRNILVFGQHNLISFLSAKEDEKREIVENLMNLKEYNLYEETAKDKLRNEKANLKSLSDRHVIQLGHLGQQQKLLADQHVLYGVHQKQIKDEITALEKLIAGYPSAEKIRNTWDEYARAIAAKQKVEQSVVALREQRNKASEQLNLVLHEFRNEQNGKGLLVEKLHKIKEKYPQLENMKRTAVVALDKIKNDMIQNERDQDKVKLECKEALQAIVLDHDWGKLKRDVQAKIAQAKLEQTTALAKKSDSGQKCPTCYGIVDPENIDGVVAVWDEKIKLLGLEHDQLSSSEDIDIQRFQQCSMDVQERYDLRSSMITLQMRELQEQWENETKKIDSEYNTAASRLDAMKQAAEKAIVDFETAVQAKYANSVHSFEVERDTISRQIVVAEKEVKDFVIPAVPTVSLEEAGKFEGLRTSSEKQLAEKKEALQVNPYGDIIAKLEASIVSMTKEVSELETAVKESEAMLPYFAFWVDAMGKEGIKSFIVDQIVPSLNQQIDYWMQSLYRGAISLTFDKFLNVKMVNKASGNEMVFGQGSGSEAKRVDLSIMLAFRDIMKMSTGKDPSIIIFDEVADSLDDDGIYHVYKTIEELSKTCHVYVITHHPTFKQLLENAGNIHFIKENGATRLAAA